VYFISVIPRRSTCRGDSNVVGGKHLGFQTSSCHMCPFDQNLNLRSILKTGEFLDSCRHDHEASIIEHGRARRQIARRGGHPRLRGQPLLPSASQQIHVAAELRMSVEEARLNREGSGTPWSRPSWTWSQMKS
jgi:hypothetical protein